MSLSNTKMNKIYNTLLAELDAGIHVIDHNGKTIIYNRKMSELEGMDANDVLNKNISEVFSFQNEENSTLIKALHNGIVTKNAKQTYFNNIRKEITTINDTFPIYDENKIIGAIEIAKDITKLERLIRDNIIRKGDTKYTFDHIIGRSKNILEVIEMSKRATRTSSSVLIIGETGTGKELFAQSIHNGSNRSSKPFISQNCAALPDSLIEGILFGTKKGAFTGAIERPGLFEQADGGTLLLDEINSLNPLLQAKLLRAIQEKTIRRVGDTKDTKIDVRIIATMNEDPIDAIANHQLRKDLFYRLSVVSLFIPPLRERIEDIPQLANTFIKKYNSLFCLDVKCVDDDVIQLFNEYNWPGNIRELEHVIEGAMNLIDDESSVTLSHLPLHFRKKIYVDDTILTKQFLEERTNRHFENHKSLKAFVNEAEHFYIEKALKQSNGNISKAAKLLGISRQSLQYRLKK